MATATYTAYTAERENYVTRIPFYFGSEVLDCSLL